jgi:NADH-quinone oxidoreductase subunit J
MKSALFFYFFAAVSVLPGIFVLATRDIVRAAFWLLASLSGFAGLYVLLGADFLAVTQVIVYLGGILILILFGVMLTHRDPALVQRVRRLNLVVPGIAGGATLAVVAMLALTRSHFATAPLVDGHPAPLPYVSFTGTTHDLGTLLVRADDQGRSYMLAFEIASVLLLA